MAWKPQKLSNIFFTFLIILSRLNFKNSLKNQAFCSELIKYKSLSKGLMTNTKRCFFRNEKGYNMIDFYSKNVSASIEDFRSSHSEWTMSSSIIFSNIEICVLSCLTSGHNFVNSLNFKFIRWPMQQNKNSLRENILKSILIDLRVDFWIQVTPDKKRHS